MPWRYPRLATAAWIIHSSTSHSAVCHGVTQVHGQPVDVNSYHTELQGMLSLLMAINHICTLHQLGYGSLLIGCDNKGVLRQIGKCTPYIPSSAKHTDFGLSTTRKAIAPFICLFNTWPATRTTSFVLRTSLFSRN